MIALVNLLLAMVASLTRMMGDNPPLQAFLVEMRMTLNQLKAGIKTNKEQYENEFMNASAWKKEAEQLKKNMPRKMFFWLTLEVNKPYCDRKIDAVKALRALTDVSLRDAKEEIEALIDVGNPFGFHQLQLRGDQFGDENAVNTLTKWFDIHFSNKDDEHLPL